MFFIKIKHSALVQYPGKKQCREKCNSNNRKKHTFALIWAKRLSSFLYRQAFPRKHSGYFYRFWQVFWLAPFGPVFPCAYGGAQ